MAVATFGKSKRPLEVFLSEGGFCSLCYALLPWQQREVKTFNREVPWSSKRCQNQISKSKHILTIYTDCQFEFSRQNLPKWFLLLKGVLARKFKCSLIFKNSWVLSLKYFQFFTSKIELWFLILISFGAKIQSLYFLRSYLKV